MLAQDHEANAAISEAHYAQQLFAQARPELLILSFASVSQSEHIYLTPVRQHPDIRPAPHQTLLQSPNKEEEQAAERGMHSAMDDYVTPRERITTPTAFVLHLATLAPDSPPFTTLSGW